MPKSICWRHGYVEEHALETVRRVLKMGEDDFGVLYDLKSLRLVFSGSVVEDGCL